MSEYDRIIGDLTKYLDHDEAYLSDPTPDAKLPDANLVCRLLPLPNGTILEADSGEDEHGPFIAARIADDEPRKARLFDPWFFVPICLQELAGASLVWHKKKQKGDPYFRLMCRTPSGHEAIDGIPVVRAVADTPPGIETRFARGHYDLRRAALTFRSATKRPHPPKFGRADVINLACGLLNTHRPTGLTISSTDFRILLERAFDLADRMHEKRHPELEAD